MFVVNQNGNISTNDYYGNDYPLRNSYVYKDFFKDVPGLEYMETSNDLQYRYDEFPYRAGMNIENSYIINNISMPGKGSAPIGISWNPAHLSGRYIEDITLDLIGDVLVLQSVVKEGYASNWGSTNLFFINGTIKIVSDSKDCFSGYLKDATLVLNNNSTPILTNNSSYDKILYNTATQKEYNFINSKIVNYDSTIFDTRLLASIYKTEFRATVKPKNTPVTTKKYTFEGFSYSDVQNIFGDIDIRSLVTVNNMTVIDESSEPLMSFGNTPDSFLVLEDFSIVGATTKNYINIEI